MRIVLIEDRKDRLDRFSACSLQDYPFLQVAAGGAFEECRDRLSQDADSYLSQFDCILSHRSAFSNEVREGIKSHCKKNRKPLLFFSGGISTGIYSFHSFPFLHINAKDFYSSNLCLFLDTVKEKNDINLLVLQFGEQWKLNVLLNFRNHLAIGANNKTLKRLGDLQLNPFLKNYLINEAGLDWVNKSELTLLEEKQVAELKSIINELIQGHL